MTSFEQNRFLRVHRERAWKLGVLGALCVGIVTLVAGPAGCKVLGNDLNPEYCAAHPQDRDCRAMYPDAALGCSSSAECGGAEAVCMLEQRACVQCTAEDSSACTGASPVCGDDHACRGCSAHGECSLSGACQPDGACADEATVAYVAAAPGGTDNGTCTKSLPCTRLASALATERPYVKLSGIIEENVVIQDRTVTLLADAGAQLKPDDLGVLLEIRGSSDVSIYDLELLEAGGAGGVCISLSAGGTQKLALHRAKVTGCQGSGIAASGGIVKVTDSTLSGSTGAGIAMTGGTLMVAGSTVSGNQGGGLTASGSVVSVAQSNISANSAGGVQTSGGSLSVLRTNVTGSTAGIGVSATAAATLTVSRSSVSENAQGGVSVTGVGTVYDITNTYIFRNGDSDSTDFGGVHLGVAAAGTSRFEFNTVVDNQALSRSGGVVCGATAFAASNNLIARNVLGTMATMQTDGCTYPTSIIQDDLAGLNFERPDTTPFSYKLLVGSSAIDQVTTPSAITVDVDGDVRPQGSGSDIGADEYVP